MNVIVNCPVCKKEDSFDLSLDFIPESDGASRWIIVGQQCGCDIDNSSKAEELDQLAEDSLIGIAEDNSTREC